MSLPEGVEPYSRSPDFTADTVPASLLSAHRTKPGVWALIHVVEGRLLYRVLEGGREEVLAPGSPAGVIEPEILHEVAPLGPVRFYIEFHRQTHGASRGR